MTSRLEVEELTVDYGNGPVVNHVSLKLEEGKILGIVGPNGAGKTSLVKAVIGLAPTTGGVVRIDGEDVSRERTEKSLSVPGGVLACLGF